MFEQSVVWVIQGVRILWAIFFYVTFAMFVISRFV